MGSMLFSKMPRMKIPCGARTRWLDYQQDRLRAAGADTFHREQLEPNTPRTSGDVGKSLGSTPRKYVMGCTPQDGEKSNVQVHAKLVAHGLTCEGPQAPKGATSRALGLMFQASSCRRPARDKMTSTGHVYCLRHDTEALKQANIPNMITSGALPFTGALTGTECCPISRFRFKDVSKPPGLEG